jgi:hypothetical protein
MTAQDQRKLQETIELYEALGILDVLTIEC